MRISPFLLTPAFRSGASTPWGGEQLRLRFGKAAPARTGESLEMSVIPGLESTDPAGVPLTELIRRFGAALTGADYADGFPLLLKLIDARERLSVQVHPDDAYASAHENKLGKTEAWVILAAEPGAQLVYGLREGISLEALRAASLSGKGVEDLLRFVPVKPGEVYYIPAGMVHAIGGGILLYEIQQSSDVTYRFYDWNRTDAQGNRRALHIAQALDVARLDLQPGAARPVRLADGRCLHEQLLDTPYFSLQRLSRCDGVPFAADGKRFSVLTALGEGRIILENGETLALHAGQSAFIPAQTAPFLLHCEQCLLAAPANKADAAS